MDLEGGNQSNNQVWFQKAVWPPSSLGRLARVPAPWPWSMATICLTSNTIPFAMPWFTHQERRTPACPCFSLLYSRLGAPKGVLDHLGGEVQKSAISVLSSLVPRASVSLRTPCTTQFNWEKHILSGTSILVCKREGEGVKTQLLRCLRKYTG